MKKYELTKRQLETLECLSSLTKSNGMPPTLRELRKALNVSSDQSVIDLLNRLELKGYVKNLKQKRGFVLLEKADFALGNISPDRNGQVSITPSADIFMNFQENEIFEKLIDIDPLLGKIYFSGLTILRNKITTDFVSLSAHEFREIVVHLCNKGKDLVDSKEEIELKNKKVIVNARKLERFQDPRGGVLGVEETIYDIFYRKFYSEGFTPISHHTKTITLINYQKLVSEFEQFLLSYILSSQPEIYSKIDNILRKDPSKVKTEELINLITLNLESYQYFYKNVSSEWLPYLIENNFLVSTSPVGNYLVRIAAEKPAEIMDFILSYEEKAGSQSIKNELVQAVIKMPSENSVEFVEKIIKEKWLIKDEGLSLLQYYINDLLKYLIESKKFKEAEKLTNTFLEIYANENKGRKSYSAKIEDYQYHEALEYIKLVPAENLEPFIFILIKKLCKISRIESDNDSSDFSQIWLPSIEDHEQNLNSENIGVSITRTIRDLLKNYTDYLTVNDPNKIKDKILSLLDSQYLVIKRIKLYLFRLYPDHFIQEIEFSLLNLFNEEDLWHEYFLLAKDTFHLVSKKTQTTLIEMIEKGPEKETDAKYIQYWKARRIKMVEKYLNEDKKVEHKDLLAIQFENPDFMSFHYSWSGPETPFSEEILASMEIEKLIETIISWAPSSTNAFDFSPSRDGLGRTLSLIVEKNPEVFIDNLGRFENDAIFPIYYRHIFYGFRNVLNKESDLDWTPTIPFLSKMIEKIKENSKKYEEDESDNDWHSVAMSLASFINALLKKENSLNLSTCKLDIWEIIKTLCEYPDPTPEHESKYGGDNMDPYTMSINSVRGEAFHALFSYMIWCNRISRKKETADKIELFIPIEAKEILEKHLVIENDPSVSIRSVYGKYLPWIISYDREWATKIIPDILPKENRDLRYAAWETYLSNPVFLEAFSIMEPYYMLAINELSVQAPKRRYWINVIENLAGHVFLAYVYGMDNLGKPLYKEYLEKATADQRGEAISFFGRSIIMRDKPINKKTKEPNLSKIKKIWIERLKTSKSSGELKEFGWWAKENFFNNEWMLSQLLKTVKITKGEIEGDHWVIKTLNKLSIEYPLLCIEILDLIIRNKDNRRHTPAVYRKEIEAIISNVFKSENQQAKKICNKSIDYLTKMGFENLRHIASSIVK